MIIKDAAYTTIKAVLNDEINRLRDGRTKEREKFLNYYEGDTNAYIQEYFKSPTLREIPVTGKNITKQIVQKRSLVYKLPPTRTNGNENKYNDYVQDLNKKCRQLEQLTYLLGTMAMLSFYDVENDKLGHSTIPFFEPYFLPGAIRPFGVSYPVNNYENAKASPKRFAFWSVPTVYENEDGEVVSDDGMYFEYDLDGNKYTMSEGDKNPYGILPVSFVHRQPQIDDFFVPGAADVIGANEQLDIAMTELMLAIRFDMLGLKYASGVDAPMGSDGQQFKVYANTDSVLILPDGGVLGRIGGGDTGRAIDAIKFMVESILQDNHLKAVWVDDATQSGIALKIENLPNMEQRIASLEEVWRPFEKDRFEIDRTILAAHGHQISEDYHVDFAEVEIPLTPDEIEKETRFNLEMGFTTYEQEYLKRNPDASDEDIKAAKEAHETKGQTQNLQSLLEAPVE